MAHKYSTLFKWINVIIDYAILNLALYACFALADRNLMWREVYDYRLTIILLNFCWFYSSSVLNVYKQILKRGAGPLMSANIASLCLFILMAAIIKLVVPDLYIPPTPFIYYFSLFPALILIWRFTFLLLRKQIRKYWPGFNNIVIVGAGPAGIDLYNYMVANPQLDYNVLGVFDDNRLNVPPHINYLGKVTECITYACVNGVCEIYCALKHHEYDRIEWLMHEADKYMVRFRLVPDIKGAMHHNFLVELFGSVPVLKTRQEPLENKANEVTKRAFDVVFSSLVLVFILSWLIPILAVLIKVDSNGPVFFKQLRSGKNNKSFYCLKFRSMTVNTDSDTKQASKDDCRVTRIGRFIRKTSIDELPQFINVLMGDMSVVGPRPHMLKHTNDYSQLIDNYMVRHFLTPGITGWAQVNGFRGETRETIAMLNRVKADLWYLENWSILLDLKIVCQTVLVLVANKENAY
ncbi:undecaprenyl-phosphate glucose phosphotransferase [Pontibacter sp. MBLB2868]|uniref:undecaprenyl-phosphate glucose phosphotransferase n=1 Tax=Pontibacter sp. MBLB2868 TaxID=3451555 RepID=UPI003F74D2E8